MMNLLIKQFDFIEPIKIFTQISHLFGSIFLDSNLTHSNYGRYSFIVLNPIDTFCASDTTSLTEQINKWKNLFNNNQQAYDDSIPPFIGGLVGFLSYDLGTQLEVVSQNNNKIIPDYILGLYNQVFAFDLLEKNCYIIVNQVNGYSFDYNQQFLELTDIYNNAESTSFDSFHRKLPQVNLTSNFTHETYIKTVIKAQQYITDGDIFEVNLAQCFNTKITHDYPCIQLYCKLRNINQAPFAAYLNFEPITLMSASPERFLSIRNNQVEARPIKGTIRRSSDINEDQTLASQLQNSEKDRAENIMIVDLMRSDLSKICTPNSVNVSTLCGVESFTNIHHLVSVINGTLKDNVSIFDIIPACFPGGSITGAPKIRAMQIIDELEPAKRGAYCGSIGYFGFNNCADFSISIRTIIKNDDDLRFYVGGAVTLDSNPEEEYHETMLKGEKLCEVFV